MSQTDTDVFDAYMTATEGERQITRARRIGRDQSWFSRAKTKRRSGAIRLPDDVRSAMERHLRGTEDPTAIAVRRAYLDAAAEVQALADRLRALAGELTPEAMRVSDALDAAETANAVRQAEEERASQKKPA